MPPSAQLDLAPCWHKEKLWQFLQSQRQTGLLSLCLTLLSCHGASKTLTLTGQVEIRMASYFEIELQ